MKKKIYLAGSCSSEDRTQMVEIANLLRDYDYDVYCPFELKIPNAWEMTQEAWAAAVFYEDIEAIRSCDRIVLISVGRESTAGTNWEQGYAYALNKDVYVFQITDKPTSLMTYCGCKMFYNSSRESICEDIYKYFIVKEYYEDKCKTTLT